MVPEASSVVHEKCYQGWSLRAFPISFARLAEIFFLNNSYTSAYRTSLTHIIPSYILHQLLLMLLQTQGRGGSHARERT